MNDKLKNIFSFIKEALELKNKNIYDVNNYLLHMDLGKFYNQYKEIINVEDYSNIDLDEDKPFLVLKYIKESKKKKIPKVPKELEKYIYLQYNDIIAYNEDLEHELEKNNLLDEYREFDRNLKEVNRYNNLIDSYNSKYLTFYNYYKKINDYEEKLDVIFGKKLLIWHGIDDKKIERYIIEYNLDIVLDPIENIIYLTLNKNKPNGFVTDFLNLDSYKVKDINMLNDFVMDINKNKDEIDLNDCCKKYVNYASIENEVTNRELMDKDVIRLNQTYLFNNCGIIIRKKNVKLWIEDFENIISLCDKAKFKSPILNLFEVDADDENQVYNLLNDNTYDDTKDDEVLFPLPSNNEQYKIVDKVKSSNIVLVQGPPGTGKSHTIANLLSHYISEGKKVIVTSEKAKALEVLRDKIPEEIRSLSLALLTSKGIDRDLEFAIENVLKKQMNDQDKVESKNKIEKLKDKLNNIHLKKQDVVRRIIDLMSKDTISYKEELKDILKDYNYDELTLMDLAKWLDQNKKYNLIPTSDESNYNYINVGDFFDKLDDIAGDIKDNKYALSKTILLNDYLKNNEIELYIKEINNSKNYNLQNDKLVSAIRESKLNKDILENLETKINGLSCLYELFDKSWIISNVKFKAFINKIIEIRNNLKDSISLISRAEENLYDYKLGVKTGTKEEKLDLIIELLNLYDNKGNISIIHKLKFNSIINKSDGLLYNDKQISKNLTEKDFKLIEEGLKYYIVVDNFKNKLNKILEIDIFHLLEIKENQLGKYVDKIISILEALINYEEYTKEINKIFNEIINQNIYSINYIETEENIIISILKDLRYYTNININSNKSECIIDELREFYKNYNLKGLDKLLLDIKENNLEDYINDKNDLLHEINIINQYNNLREVYNKLMSEKSGLIRNYIYNFTFEEKEILKNNYNKVFKYHFVLKYYLDLESKESELPCLYEQREKLNKEEKSIVISLVTEKGWYYQNEHMKYNVTTSLNKWVDLKKKLGKGTGKNSNIILRQMREEMEKAKNAIPVWIMPIDKLIEQYPFNEEPQFDVLIMDESSQSSVFSISALARAKKVIIVGDDKQISPTNAFTNIDGINELRAKYLKNNYWSLQISKDTSIYDIVQMVCGNKKVTLTEHFRCLPEIINYSNKQFYNMEINPLKVRGKNNTIKLPIKTIYVPNATCKIYESKPYNQTEINRIVMLIGEILNDKQYDDKTIGIIALQNSNKYIEKLSELIMSQYSEKIINERKIKIGSTYDFQGDERDVIILGMVISPLLDNGERYNYRALTTAEFDKSYNVAASRAKEQMILVHSVKLEELNNNCNRYKLLEYCLNYNNIDKVEKEKLFESNFEKDIYYCLTSKGFNLTPQFKVGNYRIDFVLTNDNNQKIAIECDGDMYHSINELENDIERQSVLERCGWKFVRIRASEFYYDRELSIEKMINKINEYLDNNNGINYIKSETNKDISLLNLEENKNIDLLNLKDNQEKNEKNHLFDILNIAIKNKNNIKITIGIKKLLLKPIICNHKPAGIYLKAFNLETDEEMIISLRLIDKIEIL